jgi:thiol-disulfide isomerase/thioredoxin
MNRHLIFLILLIAPLSLPVCSKASRDRGEAKSTETAAGSPGNATPMPAFVLKDLDGKEVKLEDYRGKVLMVNFWATWCGPCISEIPALNEIYRQYKNKGFELLAVASQSGDAAAIRGKVKQLGIKYPVLVGDTDVLEKYHVFAFPTDYIADRKGIIRRQFLGAPPGKKGQITATLDELLAE